MKHSNEITLHVWGRRALFTDPLTKTGGEKFTYPIPTYDALKGILESCFWKPTFTWQILSVRIMHKIQTETQNVRPISYSGGNTLSIYTYLTHVSYQVKARFVWNLNHPELAEDRNENKHFFMAKRMLEKGGRRDVFLGTRECQAYIEPCIFGEGSGFYDETPEIAYGMMVHGLTYPSDSGKEELVARLWSPIMDQGVIQFPLPEDCTITRNLGKMSKSTFTLGENASPVDQLVEEEGGIL